MKDQFSAPDRRVDYRGPSSRVQAPAFKSTIGSLDGERIGALDRRRGPADRRANGPLNSPPNAQRRLTQLPFGRREGDAARAKAAGRFVPRSYLKAAVTQAIRDFVPTPKPAAPVRVADRRVSYLSNPAIGRRDGQRRKTIGDRRQVSMLGAPYRRSYGYGRRAGDTKNYGTLPAGGRYDCQRVEKIVETKIDRTALGGKVPGLEFTPSNVTNFGPPAVKRGYDSEAARDDINLARELAELLIKVRDEVTAKSAVRASLIAVTRRIEEREKNA